jgi:hypothetical protein
MTRGKLFLKRCSNPGIAAVVDLSAMVVNCE